jgi:NAD(P)-dependent dehydrogenase (short-subunit alcohol dehydrogenase family)
MSVVVITGASAGVGRATARAYAKKRARIGLIARGMDGLRATAEEVKELGGTPAVASLDVANNDDVFAAAEQFEHKLGPIDIWINNAMVSIFSPFDQLTPEEFKRVTDVTYLGFVYGTMAAMQHMRNRGGVIVQVGSALAYRAIPLQSAYCGAKHAIEGFTESLRSEVMHDRIPVKFTMVNLPALNTPQFRWAKSNLPRKPQPIPPIYQPELAADAILWAAEHTPREFTLGLRTAIILWGNKFLSGLGDWYLGKTGYESQQLEEPDDPSRPNNLWRPVSGDPGCHGDFDDRARNFSGQFLFRTHFKTLLGAGMGASCLFLGARLIAPFLKGAINGAPTINRKIRRKKWKR